MKINSINNTSFNNNKSISFKKTAVAYPEYRNAYIYPETSKGAINSLVEKISGLFHPQVTKEAVEIKAKIDSIYATQQTPKEQLLSILA